MLYRIGTMEELAQCADCLPQAVMPKLYGCIDILDRCCGSDRNYLECGGYCFVAEQEEDLAGIYPYVDFETRVPECVGSAGKDYLAVAFMLDAALFVILFLPKTAVPAPLLAQWQASSR